ncbi:hypothetical protein NIES4071_74190 [Calothrix sp. NIES-4071]|nr:hypothetical protein NIES4071_74190 [Calothrix sp. NIES-4071]BAZ61694.1 hypothetical protein NIES4105_74140 [Calothrix sp. NIES-4105]
MYKLRRRNISRLYIQVIYQKLLKIRLRLAIFTEVGACKEIRIISQVLCVTASL